MAASVAVASARRAAKGARRVVACDVDPIAVEIAAAAGVAVFTGSADAIRAGSVDLIVANISAAASIELAPEFMRCLARHGRCIASGFENWDAGAVEAAMQRAGAAVEREVCKGQWSVIIVSAMASG